MIAKMSKYSFLVFHEEYIRFLEDIRDLGVLHVISRKQDVSEGIMNRYTLVREIQNVIRALEKREVSADEAVPSKGCRGRDAFDCVVSLFEEREHLQTQLTQLNREINQVRPWGDFSVEVLMKLKEQDIELKFFSVSSRKFKSEWLQKYPVEVISSLGGITYFVMVVRENEELPVIDAEEMRPPEKPLSLLKAEYADVEKELRRTETEIDAHAANSVDAINRYLSEVKDDISYDNTMESTAREASGKVMLLEGWVPDERKDELEEYLAGKSILHIVEQPAKGEKVPVMLKNRKFPKHFEMLGELYSLPKYQELDMTPFFAPFYMLFFGFCLGDAGYGLLMAVIALIMKRRVKKQLKSVMSLIFYLGLSTILFGIIGGTLFGIPLYETGLPVYSTLAQQFTEQGTDINQLLFYLALVFGGFQILFGMVLKAINEVRQFGWGYAVGTFGWLTLLLGGIGIYGFSHLTGKELSELSLPFYVLLAISGVMILLLNRIGRNVFMNVGVGLWTTYNMVTGILGDLLSYIRLFALGISSAIMGFVFNSLAVEMSGSIPVLSIIIMVVILVIGHSINIFMSGLGAFVHPLRLTFVEFYKNAGFSGGGKQYNPFRKIT